MNDAISQYVIYASSGLLVYWLFRAATLICATEEEIERALAIDRWWGRRLWDALLSMMDGTIAAV